MKPVTTPRGAVLWLGFFLLWSAGCLSSDQNTEVTVAVDFGPTGRPRLEKTVVVPEKSTVFDALRSAFPVATSGR
ncbi:MAG TPA: hypothetical protein VGA73_08515 [Candidatus Binatia bacterium]